MLKKKLNKTPKIIMRLTRLRRDGKIKEGGRRNIKSKPTYS